MASALDDEEHTRQSLQEAEAIIQDAATKLTPEESLAYWGYLRRWRAQTNDNKRGSADSPPRWDVPSQVLTADKHRREIITAMLRRKTATADQVKALADVNAFLLLPPDDDRLPSWARDL